MSGFEITTTKAQSALAIREKVKMNDIPQAMGRMYGELAMYMSKGVPMTGPPFAYYHSWNDQEVDLECGFPVASPVRPEGKFRSIVLPEVRAVVAVHVGPYERLVDTYMKMQEWILANGHQPADYMWESYLNSPEDTPADKLLTQVVYPIK